MENHITNKGVFYAFEFDKCELIDHVEYLKGSGQMMFRFHYSSCSKYCISNFCSIVFFCATGKTNGKNFPFNNCIFNVDLYVTILQICYFIYQR